MVGFPINFPETNPLNLPKFLQECVIVIVLFVLFASRMFLFAFVWNLKHIQLQSIAWIMIYLSLSICICIYISIQQPSRWGWLCYYCVLARWSNCLWNWLLHVRIVPFPSVLCHTSVEILLVAICQVWSIWSWLLMLFQLYASCFVHIQWQRHIISNLMTHMNPTAISSIWSCQVKQIVIPINLSSLSDVYIHK